MKTRTVINQTFSLLLAAMLLLVAGARSWSDSADTVQKYAKSAGTLSKGITGTDKPEDQKATVSALSLDAVITPAISFDFSHYFYFTPQPVWHFVESQRVIEVDFREPYFLFSCFNRIFARYIVTNAP